MKLYDRGLVRRLSRFVKERRQRLNIRKAGSGRTFSLDQPWTRGPLLLICLAALEIGQRVRGVKFFLSLLAIFCVAEAVRRARQMHQHLTSSFERAMFLFYPFSWGAFFRLTTERRLLASLWVWGVAFVTYGVTGKWDSAWVWRSAAFATLSWLLTLCSTLCLSLLLARKPEWLHPWVIPALYLLVPFGFAIPANQMANVFSGTSLLPAGWANALFVWTSGGTMWIAVTAGIVAAGIAAVWLWKDYRGRILSLEETLAGVELLVAEAGTETDETDAGERPLAEWQRLWERRFEGQIAEYIQSRRWLEPWRWSEAPWLEMAATKILNVKEKETLQYLLGYVAPDWSGRWKVGVIAAAVSSGLVATNTPAGWTMGGIALAISAGLGTPLVGGSWPLLGGSYLSGRVTPIYSCLPLGFARVSRIMIKTGLVRGLAWLPFGALVCALMAFQSGMGALPGVSMAVKGFLLWAALLPTFAAGHFSKGTNDTQNFRLRMIPLMLVAILAGLALLAGFIAAVSGPWEWSVPCLAAIAALSAGFWAIYKRAYERWQIDLLRVP